MLILDGVGHRFWGALLRERVTHFITTGDFIRHEAGDGHRCTGADQVECAVCPVERIPKLGKHASRDLRCSPALGSVDDGLSEGFLAGSHIVRGEGAGH